MQVWEPHRRREKFYPDYVIQTAKHLTRIMIWSALNSVLQEENDPSLHWPANSPDMNPTENDWELMKREIVKDGITTKAQR